MFTLIEKREIADKGFTSYWYRHDSGLQVLCINGAHHDKCFSICIDTPPTNSSGIQHIIEHSVLNGSKKFPVREPFIELLKSSIAKFINACTYPDHTIFPIITSNKKDYYNLVEVYWDAVFNANMTEQTFMQEGWHHEIQKGRLVNNGVVLNEMTGYYANLSTVYHYEYVRHLLPRSSQSYESGGLPQDIPHLTYKQFSDYYRKNYTISKAKVLMTGDIPVEEQLVFLEKLISECGRKTKKTASVGTLPEIIKSKQTRWNHPRRAYIPYKPSPNDNTYVFSCGWMLNNAEKTNIEKLTFELIDDILTGNQGSPLTKAIMSSGLGTKTMDIGYDDSALETYFHVGYCGLKSKQDCNKIKKIIFDTLEKIVRDGIPENMKTTALRQMEYDNRDIDSSFTYDLMEDIFAAWTYNYNPMMYIDNMQDRQKLSKLLKDDERYLEKFIKKWLIDNKHRSELIFCPEPKFDIMEKQKTEAELKVKFSAMTSQEKQSMKQQASELRKLQLTPNTPEALATLPKLTLKDISPDDFYLPYSKIITDSGLPILRCHAIDDHIVRLKIGIDLSTLPNELMPYWNIYSILVNRLGIQDLPYDQLAMRKDYLGLRLRTTSSTYSHIKSIDTVHNGLTYTMSVLEEHFPESLDLLYKIHTQRIFTETSRMLEILKSSWTSYKNSFASRACLPRCELQAVRGLTANSSLINYFNSIRGFEWYFEFKKFMQDLTLEKLQSYLAKFEEISNWISRAPITLATFCGNDTAFSQFQDFLQIFKYQLPQTFTPDFFSKPALMPETHRKECFVHDGINYCARAIAGPSMLDPRVVSIRVFAKIISCGYLYTNIRVKNGAYGTSAHYNGKEQISLILQSSEDSRPGETFKTFDNVRTAITELRQHEDEIYTNILSSVGKYITPFIPSTVCDIATMAEQDGMDENFVKKEISDLLALTPKQFFDDMESYFDEFGDKYNDCMVGPIVMDGFKAITK